MLEIFLIVLFLIGMIGSFFVKERVKFFFTIIILVSAVGLVLLYSDRDFLLTFIWLCVVIVWSINLGFQLSERI